MDYSRRRTPALRTPKPMIRAGRLAWLCASLLATLEVPADPSAALPAVAVRHASALVGDVEIFYREAGPKDAPGLLLLHGFPSSSLMFRHLLPALGDRWRVVAPDYPGFGHSDCPSPATFDYSRSPIWQPSSAISRTRSASTPMRSTFKTTARRSVCASRSSGRNACVR
jgi:hypothetical protein